MNMVTKSGGNRFTSDHNFFFMNDALQGTNIDDDLRAAPRPAARAARPARPATRSTSATTGARRSAARSSATRCGSSAPSAGGGSTSSRSARSTPTARRPSTTTASATSSARRTWQTTPSHPHLVPVQQNINDRFHRRDAPYLFVEDKATTLQDQPAQNYVVQYNQVLGQRLVLDARFGRMWGVFPARYQADVTPTDIAIRDVVALHAHQRRRRAVAQPERPLSGQLRRQLLPASARRRHPRPQGRPAAVVGGHGVRAHPQRRPTPRAAGRRAVPGAAGQHADQLRPPAEAPGACSCRTAGCSAAPRINARRARRRRQRLPAGADQPGRHLRRRAQLPEDRRLRLRPQHRAAPGHRPTTCSATARPRSRPTTAASTTSSAREIAEAANPNALVNQAVAWTDANGNLALDPGELGDLHRLPARPVPDRRRATPTRPYSDEINVGVEQQLRRQHRRRRQLPPPPAPQRPRHPRPGRGRRAPTRRSTAPTSTR